MMNRKKIMILSSFYLIFSGISSLITVCLVLITEDNCHISLYEAAFSEQHAHTVFKCDYEVGHNWVTRSLDSNIFFFNGT